MSDIDHGADASRMHLSIAMSGKLRRAALRNCRKDLDKADTTRALAASFFFIKDDGVGEEPPPGPETSDKETPLECCS